MAGSTPGLTRPSGVALIAFVTLAMAVVPLLALARVRMPETLPAEQAAEMRREAQLNGAWAAVGLLSAAGLFGMRWWGWWLALAYYAGTVLILLIGQSNIGTMVIAFRVGLSGLVIWYLTSKDIRTAFQRR